MKHERDDRTSPDGPGGGTTPPGSRGFALYVEGARDREILQGWGRRFSGPASQRFAKVCVILGGRRPARAVDHFRGLRRRQENAEGLCVLDSDGGSGEPDPQEPGLAFFTWSRRHIESYLLVPAAIRRSLRLPRRDSTVEDFFRQELPDPRDEHALGRMDAKRLLAPNGTLERFLGARVIPGRIARAMQLDEFHPDIVRFFGLLRGPLGFPEVRGEVPVVVERGGHSGARDDTLS